MNLESLHKRIKGSRLWVHPKSGVQRLYVHGFSRRTDKMKADAYFEIVNDRITPCMAVRCQQQGSAWGDNYKAPIIQRMQEQFHELIHDCELERKKVPLHERLRDDIIPVHEGSLMHQTQALRFCCSMKVSALFADTGTGKSKVAIDLAVSRYEAGQIKRVFLFCPVSTKKNFKEEIAKWCKHPKLEWHIVGHETMSGSDKTYLETYAAIDNDCMIIIDESHKCKTPFAKRSKRIMMCCDKVSYKLILTGTPAESVKDMYMQYAFLSPLIIGEKNWLSFEEKYLIIDDRGDIIGYKNVDYLMGLVEPYTYQIRKEDCLDLPGKQFHNIICQMTASQQDYYESTKEELLKKLEKFNEADVQPPATLIFQYFTKLQQIACGFYKKESGEHIDLGNGKMDQLVRTSCFQDQTIFFCKYLYEIEALLKYLGPENCAVFTGENPKERDEQKALFTARRKQFFVATMGSGGTGLNGLQHCNRIVFFSNSFKWIEKKQCIGRIDRQGQNNSMHIYDMVADCGIEYRILNNLERKGNLADEIKQLLHDKTKLKIYINSL